METNPEKKSNVTSILGEGLGVGAAIGLKMLSDSANQSERELAAKKEAAEHERRGALEVELAIQREKRLAEQQAIEAKRQERFDAMSPDELREKRRIESNDRQLQHLADDWNKARSERESFERRALLFRSADKLISLRKAEERAKNAYYEFKSKI